MKASFPHDRVDVPSVPRVYDYQLGGDDNYAADRELADTLIRTADWLPRAAQINRAHGAQTAAHLTRRGIRPLLHVGCGYPAPLYSAISNAREAATMIRPGAVILHVDHDPIVAAPPGTPRRPPGEHRAVCSDIRKIEELLATPGPQCWCATSRWVRCCTTRSRGSTTITMSTNCCSPCAGGSRPAAPSASSRHRRHAGERGRGAAHPLHGQRPRLPPAQPR
ncbi:SAM-dependent methyltransferase [Streptomyces kronopolitis]|uniref:SAM-dependent methyltransferase n=1 Tax=Streptomyces kronopolitis TaxID=1612435 RepID=UPI0036C45A9A